MKKQAIILAAGKGLRLKKLTVKKPKCLLIVGKRPILYHQISALKKNKIKDIIIVIGYKSKLIKNFLFKIFPDLNFIFIYNNKYLRSNTLYSLSLAAKKVKCKKTILLLNGDVLFDQKIIKFLAEKSGGKSYITIQKKKCNQEEMKAVLARDSSVKNLNKKISSQRAIGEAIGINKFSPSFWNALSKKLQNLENKFSEEYFEYAIEKTISKKIKIYPLIIRETEAIEIDYLKDLQRARKLFTKK